MDDEKWSVRSVPRSESGPGYWRIKNAAGLEYLVVAATSGNEAPVLDALVEDANRGAQAMAEDEAIDRAVDAGIEAVLFNARRRCGLRMPLFLVPFAPR